MVFFKLGADGDIRISMRSKYDVDVRSVASRHGGGGHKNAAGFTHARSARAASGADRRGTDRRDRLGLRSRP